MTNKLHNISRRRRSNQGLTLVEMTVILSVIVILTTVLVPTVMSHIAQARVIRAKQDVRIIGDAIARFYDDTGFIPKTFDSTNGRTGTRAFDLLITPGDPPALPANGSTSAVQPWVNGDSDYLHNHVVYNTPGYTLKTGERSGWNGPYISAPEADPWSKRYMINIVFLKPGGGAVDENGKTKRAVFVLSAGPDGIVQTPFDQLITNARVEGDDIAYRLQ